MISLAETTTFDNVIIQSIIGNDSYRCRLLEMGFVPGTTIQVIRRAKIGGVTEVQLRGCHVLLRTSDTYRIQIDPLVN